MSSPPTGRWTSVTRTYVGVLAARLALHFSRGLLPASHSSLTWLSIVEATGLVASVGLGLVWLHRAWTRVPEPCRLTYDDRRVEPDQAVWKLFIPLYGLFYWMFIANIGLCGAVERHLKRARAREVSVPSTLALITCLAQLVPGVNFFLSPFLWGMFMTRVDDAQAEAERLDPAERALPPIGGLRVLGIIIGSLLVSWVMLILLFLAIWQFVSP